MLPSHKEISYHFHEFLNTLYIHRKNIPALLRHDNFCPLFLNEKVGNSNLSHTTNNHISRDLSVLYNYLDLIYFLHLNI